MPWISIKGGAHAIAAGDVPVGTSLMVIFARSQDPRREEGGPTGGGCRGTAIQAAVRAVALSHWRTAGQAARSVTASPRDLGRLQCGQRGVFRYLAFITERRL